jgi:ferredoxin hydrogenase large subunit
MDEYQMAAIDYSRCISCGACMAGCPFGAITDRSSLVSVIHTIQSGRQIYAVFAPAIEGHFGTANVGQLKEGLRSLGFTDAVEVSLGADATAYHEAQELKEVVTEGKKMTTSCCPAFVEMIEKHFPKLEPQISHTASPMTMTVRYLKEQNPDCMVVFFGPCVAKKLEIQKTENTADFVMTFEELAAMFEAKQIEVEKLETPNVQDGSIKGKNFAVSGGVTAAVEAALAEDGFDQPVSCVKCSGAKECKKQLMIMNAGRMKEDLIEGMACEGGCVAGPGGVEPVQKLMKNRQKLLATADQRGIKENLEEHGDMLQIPMEQRA